jgi:predicted HTH transcriptional regulator
MHDQMLDHGLDPPLLGTDMGYFQVIFLGPGHNIERLRVPEKRLLVTPAVESKLNERQRAMVSILVGGEALTSRRCEEEFGVTRDTANRDFSILMELGLATKEGQGRSTRYSLAKKT